MKRRALLLTLSLIVALVGTVLVGLYVKGADDRAQRGQALVQVMVATGAIDKGTTAKTAALKVRQKAVPQSTLTGLDPFALPGEITALGGRTLLIDVREGQPLSQTFFSAGQSSAATGSGAAADSVTLNFGLTPSPRATGLIAAGDSVTLLVTAKDKTQVFLKKALVSAVNGVPAGGNDATGAAGTVAMTVSLRDAARIVHAQSAHYDLYIVKPTDPNSVREITPVTEQNVLNP